MNRRTSKFSGLEDVETKHRQDPRTYSIPREEQRTHLGIGDVAKLVFLFDPPVERYDAERMWVEVCEVEPPLYRGELQNEPAFIADLHYGDVVEFHAKHVAAMCVPENGPQIPWGSMAAVSVSVADGGEWPQELVRLEPNGEWSGWVIYSASDSSEDERNTDNFLSVTVDELIRRFQILDSVLDEPVGTAWEWDDKALEYRRSNNPRQ